MSTETIIQHNWEKCDHNLHKKPIKRQTPQQWLIYERKGNGKVGYAVVSEKVGGDRVQDVKDLD